MNTSDSNIWVLWVWCRHELVFWNGGSMAVKGRLQYAITPENHEKLRKIQAFIVLDGQRSAELSDLVNIAIEKMYDGIIEDLLKDGGKYKVMLAEMLQNGSGQ